MEVLAQFRKSIDDILASYDVNLKKGYGKEVKKTPLAEIWYVRREGYDEFGIRIPAEEIVPGYNSRRLVVHVSGNGIVDICDTFEDYDLIASDPELQEHWGAIEAATENLRNSKGHRLRETQAMLLCGGLKSQFHDTLQKRRQNGISVFDYEQYSQEFVGALKQYIAKHTETIGLPKQSALPNPTP